MGLIMMALVVCFLCLDVVYEKCQGSFEGSLNTNVFFNTRVLVSTNAFLEINSMPGSFQYF